MRLSSVLDSRLMMLRVVAQAREQGREAAPEAAAPRGAPPAQPVPDDLDQRVRQSGEWQLEDW